jgi:8-oxo-dGTP pyrophosphatase MutT (NUDIX family)
MSWWCRGIPTLFAVMSLSSSNTTALTFPNRLPESRLGESHPSLEAFRLAITPFVVPSQTKEFTLVVVTAAASDDDDDDNDDRQQRRILLGMKNRGFGKGMYNSFGGKFDSPEESVEECACRELQEETNITISVEEMKHQKVGIQRYTFEQDPVEMIMHVFRIHLKSTPEQMMMIRGCDEITPEWFEDWNLIPLHNMFADDSLWLTTLLSSSSTTTPLLRINGWYHFRENCQETNTILHYYMQVDDVDDDEAPQAQAQAAAKQQQSFSLEKRLFHAIHDHQIRSPRVKEFKECFAFMNAVRSFFGKKKNDFDVVIDVAGGHGALAALFLICTRSAQKAVVIDPARVGRQSVQRAWKDFIPGTKTLLYREECLRTGLPQEIQEALALTTKDRILVIACHACQHLSEEILDIACRRFGVHAAVMPCCQKDLSPGSSWKQTCKNLNLPIAPVMDILLAGKIMGLGTHDVRMKSIDSKITPQNRIIICRRLEQQEQDHQSIKEDKAHVKLESAYKRAHAYAENAVTNHHHRQISSKQRLGCSNNDALTISTPVWYVATGFAVGLFTAFSFARR